MKRAAIIIYESEDSADGDAEYLMAVIGADAMDVIDYKIENLDGPNEDILAHDYSNGR